MHFPLFRSEYSLIRFILLFSIGALVVAGSQIALSLGIHPDHLASLRYILQSGTGLVLGTAMATTGLLGLAESSSAPRDASAPCSATKRSTKTCNFSCAATANSNRKTGISGRPIAASA